MLMERIGLTGWLDPEGVFHPCGFSEHSEYAQKILESYNTWDAYDRIRDEKLYIPMGGDYDENDAYVFLNIDNDKLEPIITDKQKKWFDDNFHRLAKGQQEMVADWLYDE